MALTLTLPANADLSRPEYPNAYARVLHALVYANEVFIHVNWYESEEARRNEDQPVHQEGRLLAPSDISGEVFPQAYGFLKGLPEFAGAVDC